MWTDHGETNCLLSLSLLLRRKIWVSETLGELSRLPQARAVWPVPVASKSALMGLDSLCPQRRGWKMSQGQMQSDCQAGKLEHCGSHLGCMSYKANVVEGHGKHLQGFPTSLYCYAPASCAETRARLCLERREGCPEGVE